MQPPGPTKVSARILRISFWLSEAWRSYCVYNLARLRPSDRPSIVRIATVVRRQSPKVQNAFAPRPLRGLSTLLRAQPPLERLLDFRQNGCHLFPAEGAHRVALDVAKRANFKHESAHGFVVGCIEHDYHVISAHRPEFFHDLHAHFLGFGHRGVAPFDGFLDVADALIGKLN